MAHNNIHNSMKKMDIGKNINNNIKSNFMPKGSSKEIPISRQRKLSFHDLPISMQFSKRRRAHSTCPDSTSPNFLQQSRNESNLCKQNILYASILKLKHSIKDGSIVSNFEKLETGRSKYSANDARSYENLSKNRYSDIMPYDHSRVHIKGLSSDYINANFVKFKDGKTRIKKRFIAAQGPLPNTCIDFWIMCWEQNTDIIVMLTDIKENGKAKCHKYWPDVNQTYDYHWYPSKVRPDYQSNLVTDTCYKLRIVSIKEKVMNDIIFREFMVSKSIAPATKQGIVSTSPITINHPQVIHSSSVDNDLGPRRIFQLQYLNWPDHDVPVETTTLISFVDLVHYLRGQNQNILVVHCSAGIGRTGVFILMDMAMNLIKAKHPVYPLEIVREMRDYREMLVQTSSQFKFVCKAIMEYFQNGVSKQLYDLVT